MDEKNQRQNAPLNEETGEGSSIYSEELIEKKLSEDLGMSYEEFQNATEDIAEMTKLTQHSDTGTDGEDARQFTSATEVLMDHMEVPDEAPMSIEEQISSQVQEKVQQEDELIAAKIAEEKRTQEVLQAAEENEKGKKRKKIARIRKKKGCIGGFFYIIFVIGVSIMLALFGWVLANDMLGLVKPSEIVHVEVPENFTISQVSDMLKEKHVIEYPWFFRIYAGVSHAEEKIDPGSYEIRQDLDYRAIVHAMTEDSDYRTIVKVTIPEGFTLEDTFERLAENGVATEEELWEAARTESWDYEWFEDIPEGTDNRLEGYLFPDTYEFYVNESPRSVLGKMLYNFEYKLTAEWRERAQDQGRSIYEIVTVASMIEKEAAGPEEAATIASVIYNRLENWDAPYLNIDATIQYVLPERKAELTYDDLQIDSPYNTYTNQGLPPGPISNPGYYSLKAALYPEDTDYYYYALGNDGVHHFFNDSDDFEDFLNSLDEDSSESDDE